MSSFSVSGTWKARDGWQRFEKRVDAENEDVAAEHVLAEFGSKHGLERTKVEIEEVKA
ncbi:MAG: 50S ribosomal protein L18Ae [Haloarculaceae archaeon]